MDRSVLSHRDVVNASRKFVCIRLATYEDAEEADFLKSIFLGRTGQLENTVFCLLSPDGKRRLTRAGRSPNMVFGGDGETTVQRMVEEMHRVANTYALKSTELADRGLPLLGDLRLAVNVAACDKMPLVALASAESATLTQLQDRIRPLAWSDDFIGRFAYVLVSNLQDFKPILGSLPDEGFVIIEPETFGMSGETLVDFSATATEAQLADGLTRALVLHRTETKDSFRHIAEGRRQGVDWKTAIPVTDPGPPNSAGRGTRPPGQRPR
jgi:hypothetical protein